MNIFLKFSGKFYPRSYKHVTFTLQGSKFNIEKSVYHIYRWKGKIICLYQ